MAGGSHCHSGRHLPLDQLTVRSFVVLLLSYVSILLSAYRKTNEGMKHRPDHITVTQVSEQITAINVIHN